MKDLKVKVKRQAEILGLAISKPGKYQTIDFEVLFDVNTLTIKRDMQELRAIGIDIHSNGKKGVSVDGNIEPAAIREILEQYMGIAVNRNSYNQATSLMVKKLKENAIGIMAQLQRAVESRKRIKIDYYKTDSKKVERRYISPLCIFQSEKNWRLLALHENIIKQFLLNNIRSVEVMTETFKRPPQEEIDSIFSTSFRSWLGTEKYKVKLLFEEPWADRMKPKLLMEKESITDNKDGSVTYETTVNSLSEIASWIVSRGKGVKVIEPKELRETVITIAKNTLTNYDS